MSDGENKTQHTQACFSGSLGLVWRTSWTARAFRGAPAKAKALPPQAPDQSIEISGVHLGRVGAFAGHQSGGPPTGKRSSGGRSLGTAGLGGLQRRQPSWMMHKTHRKGYLPSRRPYILPHEDRYLGCVFASRLIR